MVLAELGLPVEIPPRPAERRRARFVTAVTALIALWLGGVCVLGTAVAGNFFIYPYARENTATEHALDKAAVWLLAFLVGGPLLIALVSAAGRLPIVAVSYTVVAVVCGLLVLSAASVDLTPGKPVPASATHNRAPHPQVSAARSAGIRPR